MTLSFKFKLVVVLLITGIAGVGHAAPFPPTLRNLGAASTAPSVLSAALSETETSITVSFNQSTQLGKASDVSNCSDIFTADTLRLLGPCNCTWPSTFELYVKLASSSSFNGGNLTLKNHSISNPSGSAFMPLTTVVVSPRSAPPSLLLAQLSPSGHAITITFSSPSDLLLAGQSGSVLCSSLFANLNLGSGAMCRWASTTSLIITPGIGSATSLITYNTSLPLSTVNSTVPCGTTSLDSTLQLLSGVIAAVPNAVLTSPTQCVAVIRPSLANYSLPVTLHAPSLLSVCDDLTLDASGTVDPAGRGLSFVWYVFATNTAASLTTVIPTSGATAVPSSYSGLLRNGSVLFIPNSNIQPNASFIVTVTVTDAFGSSGSATVNVSISTGAVPTLTIFGPLGNTVNPSMTFQLYAVASYSACGGDNDVALNYDWNLISATVTANADPGYSRQITITPSANALSKFVRRSQGTLTISSGVAQAGVTYLIAVTVSVAEFPNATVTAQYPVTVASGGVAASIALGSRQLSVFSNFTLDATESVDLDRIAGQNWTYVWSCLNLTLSSSSSACVTSSGSPLPLTPLPKTKGGVLAFLAGTLPVGVYSFSVTASLGVIGGLIPNHYRAGTANVTITIVPGEAPTIEMISPQSQVVNPLQRVPLVTVVTPFPGTNISSMMWSSPNLNATQFDAVVRTASTSLPYIVLLPSSLTAGVYTFTLTAISSTGDSSSSSAVLTVNAPPQNGYVTISPTSGIALQTHFTMATYGWTDVEANFPLSYRFAYTAYGDEFLLSLRGSPANSVGVAYLPSGGPPSNAVGAVVYAIDVFGCYARCVTGPDYLTPATAVVSPPAGVDIVSYIGNHVSQGYLNRQVQQGQAGFALVGAATVLKFLSTDMDPCAGVMCANNGVCVLGECSCPSGYTGPSCQGIASAVDGVWSDWSEWSPCSVSCGGGFMTSARSCTGPFYGGAPCFGNSTRSQPCNTKACGATVVNGGYSQWSDWWPCSSSCDGAAQGYFPGVMSRYRTCTHPTPSLTGRNCSALGPSVDTEVCNTDICQGPLASCPGSSALNGTDGPTVQCNGNGNCVRQPPHCRQGDQCTTFCVCNSGYSGADCSSNNSSAVVVGGVVSACLSAMVEAVAIVDIDATAAASISASLATLMASPGFVLTFDERYYILILLAELIPSVNPLDTATQSKVLFIIGELHQSSVTTALAAEVASNSSSSGRRLGSSGKGGQTPHGELAGAANITRQALEVIGQFVLTLLTDALPGELATELASARLNLLGRRSYVDSIGSTLTSGNVGASFSPSDLQSATGVDGTTVVDTIVTQWQTNPYAIYNNTATPVGGVVSVHLYAYGSNDSVVNVTFDAPVAVVNVNVSLGTDFSTFACTYWDATAANWSTYGMTVVNYTVDDSGNIVAACASTHLSDFAAQTQASFLHIQLPGLSGFYAILDGFLSGQNLYPSIVIIIAVFMSVCFALIFIRLDKNAKRKLLLTTLQRWHVLAYGEVDAEYVPAIKGDIIRTDAGKTKQVYNVVKVLVIYIFKSWWHLLRCNHQWLSVFYPPQEEQLLVTRPQRAALLCIDMLGNMLVVALLLGTPQNTLVQIAVVTVITVLVVSILVDPFPALFQYANSFKSSTERIRAEVRRRRRLSTTAAAIASPTVLLRRAIFKPKLPTTRSFGPQTTLGLELTAQNSNSNPVFDANRLPSRSMDVALPDELLEDSKWYWPVLSIATFEQSLVGVFCLAYGIYLLAAVTPTDEQAIIMLIVAGLSIGLTGFAAFLFIRHDRALACTILLVVSATLELACGLIVGLYPIHGWKTILIAVGTVHAILLAVGTLLSVKLTIAYNRTITKKRSHASRFRKLMVDIQTWRSDPTQQALHTAHDAVRTIVHAIRSFQAEKIMVRFEELKTWDTMQATRRQLQTYIYLLIIMCGAVCIFFCVDYSVEFTSRQNLSWVYNMISVVLYDMLLFDPLTELIRLGIRFFYKISHVDLESVIRPTHDRRVVNSRLIDAVQQRIVREEVRAAARGYTSKQQIVPSSSSLQLAARSDFEL